MAEFAARLGSISWRYRTRSSDVALQGSSLPKGDQSLYTQYPQTFPLGPLNARRRLDDLACIISAVILSVQTQV